MAKETGHQFVPVHPDTILSGDPVLTTPPVHDAGPDLGQKEIEGGDASRTGVHSRLREAFEEIITNFAARNTRVVIAAPVRQLAEAAIKVVGDIPRIPDYDHVSASLASWSLASDYSPIELPEADPDSIGVFVRDQGPDAGKVCVEITQPGQDQTTTLDFEPDYIEAFFLAGLAACVYAKAQRA